ncbi:MAG: glutamine--scyllo-inositol aminotransferase [Candidatus Hydrothermarchaeota archaeon]|nr:MAG: glutamine--scyllo-inositol aminotransferase [Candidatus Hydrothermarchaeota archaeon]
MKYEIPLVRPYFDSEELEEIKKVLDSGWVTQGPKVKEFEDKITDYLGVKHAIAVTNCTSALHLALISVGVKRGDEVLVADFTFPATGHAVLYCGAKPVFVDVDLKTYNINPSLIKDRITNRTKAIIPVHTFGQSAEMDKIMEIAEEYNLKVIEDAACALGARYKNRYAGTIGDIGCFSFHARKGITTGEGGMVVTDNKDLAEKIRNLSVFGMTSAWDREKSDKLIISKFTDMGYNYKMSDITAAVGVAQLRKLYKIIKRKRELARYWDDKLEEIEFIEPPYVSENVLHVYQAYVALVDKRINRNKLIEKLMEKGIQTQIGTYASHIQPVYNSGQKCPNSLEIFNRSLALPIYYMLREEDIDMAASHLKKALEDLK